ncbi:MAG TPA: VTT domain-containing protein [Pyrinomonadaceae bacterium]|nr:TVP38/TMEM64 family protein [Acidobacteriota bacterium]HQZ95866.1 VTT domain-containing protein [Pyrinomonadaceae bacterium]
MKTRISKTTSIVRTIILVIWATIVLACIGTYLADPSRFTAENIAEFLRRFSGSIWLIYLAFSALRGITLLPSTPLVIAGTLLFPEQPFAVLLVSMTGIMLSSTMIYFFSEYLGFSEYFEGHKPELSHKIKAKLEHPLGFLFVAGWAFFPLIPTDLVCYLAGSTKMNYWEFIAAVFVGELILCVCYIYFGGSLLEFVR